MAAVSQLPPGNMRPIAAKLPSDTEDAVDDMSTRSIDMPEPRFLDVEHLYRVNGLIEKGDEEQLLHVDDAGTRTGRTNLMQDPVLSIVIACKKESLALRLIENSSNILNNNYFGDTALHVAATMKFNNLAVVKALVSKDPRIVHLTNKKGETALHKAALNGHREVFWFLEKQGSSVYARMEDGSTVLHCAITGNAPALALEIAKKYRLLIASRTVNGETPLQLIVTIPDLFRRKLVVGSLRKLMYNLVGGTDDDHHQLWERIRKKSPSSYATILDFAELISSAAVTCVSRKNFEDLDKIKRTHKEALDLVSHLAKPEYFDFHNQNESPLIMGVKQGHDECVLKILDICPQSATYFDRDGKNVLQAAVIYRRKEIVTTIASMIPLLPTWLYTHVDFETGNTLLHYASEKIEAKGDAVFQLQEEIEWFEMVKRTVPEQMRNCRNSEDMTAQDLFSKEHKPMLDVCKKQLTEKGKTCSGLLAAVFFASSFSIPGEKDPATGNSLYSDKLPFKVFFHAYVIGFVSAAMSLVLFLFLFISPFEETDFRLAVPRTYFMAMLSFALAVMAFLVSSASNAFLQIYDGQRKDKELIPLTLELTVLPAVCVFVLLYSGARIRSSFSRLWSKVLSN